jgi:hypothetical protein
VCILLLHPKYNYYCILNTVENCGVKSRLDSVVSLQPHWIIKEFCRCGIVAQKILFFVFAKTGIIGIWPQ